MLIRVQTLSQVFEREFGVQLDIGVGIHFGAVIVGQMGPVDDLRFGLVGETVIIASRLESHTRVLGVPLIVSSAVIEQMEPLQGLEFSAPQIASLKGIESDIQVYSISGN